MSGAFQNYVKNKFKKPGPLKGIRVLEVCTLLFGPAGPSFLGQMGAEVIKVELPPLGDVTRSLNPFGWFYKEQGPAFMHINPNKLYLALDLHRDNGQQIFRELAAKADIIEFNMRPGVTDRWNVGYEQIKEINPGIIYIEKNGFGQWGEYAEENRPSNDGAAQALAGFAWISSFAGRPPLKQSIWVCDVFGALMGEVAVLSALHHRKRTGKGQYIEMSQIENIMRPMGWVWPYQQFAGKSAEPRETGTSASVLRIPFCAGMKNSLPLPLRRPKSSGPLRSDEKTGTDRGPQVQGPLRPAQGRKCPGHSQDYFRLGDNKDRWRD